MKTVAAVHAPEAYATKKIDKTKIDGITLDIPSWVYHAGKHPFDAIAAVISKGRRERRNGDSMSSFGYTPVRIYALTLICPEFRNTELGQHISYLKQQLSPDMSEFRRAIRKLTENFAFDDLIMYHMVKHLLKMAEKIKPGLDPVAKFKAVLLGVRYGSSAMHLALTDGKNIVEADPSGFIANVLNNLQNDTEESRIAVQERNRFYNQNPNSVVSMRIEDTDEGEPEEMDLRKSRLTPLALGLATTLLPQNHTSAMVGEQTSPSVRVQKVKEIFNEMAKKKREDIDFKDVKSFSWNKSKRPILHDVFAAIESSGREKRVHQRQNSGIHKDTQAVSSYGLMPVHVIFLANRKELRDTDLGKHIKSLVKEHAHDPGKLGKEINRLTQKPLIDDFLMEHQLKFLDSQVDKVGVPPEHKTKAMAFAHRYGTGKLHDVISSHGVEGLTHPKMDAEGYVTKFAEHHKSNTPEVTRSIENRLKYYN